MAQPKKNAYCGNCRWWTLKEYDDGFMYDVCTAKVGNNYCEYSMVCNYFQRSRKPRKVKKAWKRIVERNRKKRQEAIIEANLPF